MIEKFSTAQITTPNLDFTQALRAYVEAGIGGIGIWEEQLGQGPDNDAIKRFIASGLKCTLGVPRVWSILPNQWVSEPADPIERIKEMCASVRRLASFDPVAIGVQTGPIGDRDEGEAWELIETGLRRLARTAAGLHPRGLNIAVEPVHPKLRKDWSPVTSLAQAVELVGRVGEPNLKIVLDVWHLADDLELHTLGRYLDDIALIQIADRIAPDDSWRERRLPGEGNIDLLALIRELYESGYLGWYELEIVSDDGRLDKAVIQSLWDRPHNELLTTARKRFRDLHHEATGIPVQ